MGGGGGCGLFTPRVGGDSWQLVITMLKTLKYLDVSPPPHYSSFFYQLACEIENDTSKENKQGKQ